MIVSLYLEKHEYLIKEPQTMNFGGKYLYSFHPDDEKLIVKRRLNDKYIPDFFNVSASSINIELLSAIVGENGTGKSSILDVFRWIFIDEYFVGPNTRATVLIEVGSETKVLYAPYSEVYVQEIKNKRVKLKKISRAKKEDIQTIYYSPHFDLKYNQNFDPFDKYEISLDQFIKEDLENLDERGPNESGWKYALHDELVFKNTVRQIEFLSSELFSKSSVFREVFNLPEYKTGILYFRDFRIPDYNNISFELRSVIKVILEKVENERKDWPRFRDSKTNLSNSALQAVVNKYLLERFVMKAFLSTAISQMEKSNMYLEEATIEGAHNTSQFDKATAFEVFSYFITESYILRGEAKTPIFDHNEILAFIKKLNSLFEKKTNPDFITTKSVRVDLIDLRMILDLHRKILTNLFHYYPMVDDLIDKDNYVEGFISFKPTDRNMSSGENALLNFFSKLYHFINNNLVEERKFLSGKKNYILLLDEADLGFHPVWKKKFIDAILKTIPFFFEDLREKPDLQIIVTTHDPLTLSDLPINNVVFLGKDGNYCRVISEDDQNKIQKTFAANITDLLAHSFFVSGGLIGDFAKSKIKMVIDWINQAKELPEESKALPNFITQLEKQKKVIRLIDEKVVRLKLTEMIAELTEDDDYFNNTIDKEIELLTHKKRKK